MVDFIRMSLLELWRSQVGRELQNVKFLPTGGHGTFCLRCERATTELRGLMTAAWIKKSPGFTCAIFRNLSVASGRCSKIICRELQFVNSLQSANFLIGQTSKRYKYMTKIHDKSFCYIYHVVQVNF